jgi:hypothetical protein
MIQKKSKKTPQILVFGGIHSATPYQCLNDGWVLDTENMEWKKITFKAAVSGKKGSYARRMTGMITERPVRGRSVAAADRRSSRMPFQKTKISFMDLANAASRKTGGAKVRSEQEAGKMNESKLFNTRNRYKLILLNFDSKLFNNSNQSVSICHPKNHLRTAAAAAALSLAGKMF